MRKTMTLKKAVLAAAVLALAVPAFSAGVGTTGADFLNVGIGARQLAMGSAFTAVETGADANAVNWNPAALALATKRNVSLSYNSLFLDENQGFAGYSQPVKNGRGVWAAGLNYLTISNIQARSADTENPDSTFSNDNYALSGSYAVRVGDNLAVGGSAKFIHEQFFTFSASAQALDLGLLYQTPIPKLTAGAAMHNLGTNIGPDQLPLDFQGGLAYQMLSSKLTVDGDVDWMPLDQTSYLSLGAEYWFNPILALRAGYQFGHGADQLQSKLVGLGVGLGLKVHSFNLDYAFLPYGNLGDTHRVTLGWSFY